MSNRLINETSPYLLQHAHNPVDWYPWGEEALQKAIAEDKPILVSIGYSACHWCHVMEKESFENEETAALMNEKFINIKIDREERPDLDHIYMDAVQAMTGSGGWPLNVFLTPDKKPFFGGTYFPPVKAFNRSSWKKVLLAVSYAFDEKRDEINSQAENLTQYLLQSNSFGQDDSIDANEFSKQRVDETFVNLMKSADKRWGGFGSAPKFPQTFLIQFMLRYHHLTKNEEALAQASLSLDKMIGGGIYDHVGGGFARYSTDSEWLVPHFEKMLYDNALIISVLSEAYQVTGKEIYKEVVHETIEFVQRELMNPACGFYSALDADSEGEEGKFYTWSYDEVTKLLDKDAEVFCEYFDITKQGNWEGRTILRTKRSLEDFAQEKSISIDQLKVRIEKGKKTLLAQRNNRVRPGLDDKIILGWNALMNTACSKAFAATGDNACRELAIANMNFLFAQLKNGNESGFHHSWKNSPAKNFAFLDDYAFLVEALLHLQEITGNIDWLNKAREIAEYAVKNFSEEANGFFFFTDVKQKDVVVRKKELYDGATPSGNATMAYVIYHLSIFFDIPEWRKRAAKMVTAMSTSGTRYPTSFGIWISLLMELSYGTSEIVVTGKASASLAQKVLAQFIPNKIFINSAMGGEDLPLLVGKGQTEKNLIYLCKDYSCLKPVNQVEDLLILINVGNKN